MNCLSQILSAATEAIEQDYFKLPINEAPSDYRERVYCYELYHQMRLRWPNDCRYRLNGEVDKNGHKWWKENDLNRRIPDFLIHVPGNMDCNYCIIEVKRSKVSRGGIRKDLNTLKTFVLKAQYRRAIFLVYGENAERTTQAVNVEASKLADSPRIELWLHTEPGSPAIHKLDICATAVDATNLPSN
jgi:hypothetical protein